MQFTNQFLNQNYGRVGLYWVYAFAHNIFSGWISYRFLLPISSTGPVGVLQEVTALSHDIYFWPTIRGYALGYEDVSKSFSMHISYRFSVPISSVGPRGILEDLWPLSLKIFVSAKNTRILFGIRGYLKIFFGAFYPPKAPFRPPHHISWSQGPSRRYFGHFLTKVKKCRKRQYIRP